ncbi:hypothetical protein [Brevundimonas sp.]|uniref:hypothetical protein n=1 Tax=Brevundimonas sp. TaxID=1871086 RepID=UPI003D1375CF
MLAAALIAAALLSGASQDPALPALTVRVTCNAGPLEREYGGLNWLVFACSNGGVIFGGKPDTVAASSLFIWSPKGDGYELTLETGLEDRALLAPAETELGALTLADLQALITEARSASH